MPTAQRIKVRVADLIERVEAAKRASWARHQDRLAKYDADTTEYKAQLAAVPRGEAAFKRAIAQRLRVYAKAIATADIDDLHFDTHYDRLRGEYVKDVINVPLGFDETQYIPATPTEPNEPYFDDDEYDRDIALLKMSTDDVISISTSDRWSRYL